MATFAQRNSGAPMKIDRRAFLRAAGIAPAAAATGLYAQSAVAASVPAGSELLRTHFAPLSGQTFTFEQEVFDQIDVTLVEAVPLECAADGERCFRLLFEAQPGKKIAQGTYRVTHPRIGTVAIFVSPNDAKGRIAEAVFNRLPVVAIAS
jgi:hypothetical protein